MSYASGPHVGQCDCVTLKMEPVGHNGLIPIISHARKTINYYLPAVPAEQSLSAYCVVRL